MGVRKAEALGAKESPGSAEVERDSLKGPVRTTGSTFWITLTDGSELRCEKLLLATGGNRSSAGFTIAEALGHTIEPLVPSLFTFHIDDARLIGLSGVSLENAVASVGGSKLRESG